MMAKIPQSGWAALWIANGGSPAKADLASAVVMAESGGDSTVDTNPCCKGGYQINVEVGNTSRACAMNAVCATRWAIKESKNGRDWSAWEAYTNGSYRQFLGGSGKKVPRTKRGAQKMVDLELGPLNVPLPGPDINPLFPSLPYLKGGVEDLGGLAEGLPVVGGPVKALTDISAFFVGLGELVLTPEGWLRLAKLIGGAILALWGLRIVIRESTGTDPVNAATKTATKGAELAALAATVK